MVGCENPSPQEAMKYLLTNNHTMYSHFGLQLSSARPTAYIYRVSAMWLADKLFVRTSNLNTVVNSECTVPSDVNSHIYPVVDLVRAKLCMPSYGQHKSHLRSVHFDSPSPTGLDNTISTTKNMPFFFFIIKYMPALHCYNLNMVKWNSADPPVYVQTFVQRAQRPMAAAVVRGERVDFIFSHITSVLPGQDSGSF